MNVFKERFDPDIEKKLSILENVPARDPEAAARGRASFLEEAHALTPPVQHSASARNGWFGALLAAFAGNRRAHAFAFLASITLVLVMLLGGTSGTVYAAQGSMPGQVLYSVKLLSEDLRLSLTSNPQAELKLISELVNRRVEEIDFLVAAGDDVPDSIVNRMQAHLDQAVNIAEANEEIGVVSEDVGDLPILEPILKRPRDQDRTKTDVDPKCNWGGQYIDADKVKDRYPGCWEILNPDQDQDISNEGDTSDGSGNAQGAGPGDQGSSGSAQGPGTQPDAQPGNSYGPGPVDQGPPRNTYGPSDQQEPPGNAAPPESGAGEQVDPGPPPNPDPQPEPQPESQIDPQPEPSPEPEPEPQPEPNCEGDNCTDPDPAQEPPPSEGGEDGSSGDSDSSGESDSSSSGDSSKKEP